MARAPARFDTVTRIKAGRWQRLIESNDLNGIKRVLTGLDRDSIEMREATFMRGLLSTQERSEVLTRAR